MELRRLQAADYDALLDLLHVVFTRQNGYEMDFEKQLPKMCVRDDVHMGKHFGIFTDGKLVSVIGVYPLETVIAGEKLLFSTMGNIATHWDYTGRGYMSKLIERAQQELEAIGADASRLGGNRQRYNRYGFESCGQSLILTFAENTLSNRFPQAGQIEFAEIKKEDTAALTFCAELYNQNEIAVTRTAATMFATMTAWEYRPYLCLSNGQPVGYFCVDSTGQNLAELSAVDTQRYIDILCRWQQKNASGVTVTLQPYMVEKLHRLTAACNALCIRPASQFLIRNWTGVITALMKLKARYCKLEKGEFVLEITGYGAIRMYVTGGGFGCERTTQKPQLVLNRLQATRFLFGPLEPLYVANAQQVPAGWLPLPLSWNGQDRV